MKICGCEMHRVFNICLSARRGWQFLEKIESKICGCETHRVFNICYSAWCGWQSLEKNMKYDIWM